MNALELLRTNLLAPIFLAFLLGWVATWVRSDLKFPDGLYSGLSAYLMLAIGLKGGAELSHAQPAQLIGPIVATIILSIATPGIAYLASRKVFKYEKADAAALAAHYGSVSAVTFIAATSFAEATHIAAPGFMPALVAILEIPAIVVGLALGRSGNEEPLGKALRQLVTSKSIFLLLGGLIIGMLSTKASLTQIQPLFGDLFKGALVIFMLDMGLIASARFKEVRGHAARLIGFGILVPVINGLLGTFLGLKAGLPIGGAGVLGTMTASASYIAAPAAVRSALPTANPGIYLPAAIAITFPFNLSLGIPLFFEAARWMNK
ncbi:MAG: sodium-dependent bicarbonate transport family permease [Armatimonadota bacterium]